MYDDWTYICSNTFSISCICYAFNLHLSWWIQMYILWRNLIWYILYLYFLYHHLYSFLRKLRFIWVSRSLASITLKWWFPRTIFAGKHFWHSIQASLIWHIMHWIGDNDSTIFEGKLFKYLEREKLDQFDRSLANIDDGTFLPGQQK